MQDRPWPHLTRPPCREHRTCNSSLLGNQPGLRPKKCNLADTDHNYHVSVPLKLTRQHTSGNLKYSTSETNTQSYMDSSCASSQSCPTLMLTECPTRHAAALAPACSTNYNYSGISLLPALGVAEHLVGFSQSLEVVCRLRVVGVLVRVYLH